jgi:hypothetical protein
MGWWATGHGDDVMGDDPADILIGMFKYYMEISGKKPSLQEVLDALAHILRSDGSEILADSESMKGRHLAVRFSSSEPALVSRPQALVDELLLNFAVSLREVAESYEQSGLSRKPRVSEVLEAFTAILHAEPERFLREAEGTKIEAFELG